MTNKRRVEIPEEVAARILFLSDRTCCVCRVPRKPVQIHHLDEDPSNSVEENLAVLCFECHRDTQIQGGFDRKLDAQQLILYRADWYGIVERKRHGPDASLDRQSVAQNWNWMPKIRQIQLQGKPIRLSYVQISEKDDEQRYSFEAEYPEIIPSETTSASETNLCITASVIRVLQRFRAEAISRSNEKKEMLRKMEGSPHARMVWDSVSMSFEVTLFSEDFLVLDFRFVSYVALAAHPNSNTKTLNFLLRPCATLLELHDLFNLNSAYLEFISRYCIDDLHSRLPESLKRASGETKDSWIMQGAWPRHENFKKFLVTKGGLRVIFDPYEVSCYAEGRRDVPARTLRNI